MRGTKVNVIVISVSCDDDNEENDDCFYIDKPGYSINAFSVSGIPFRSIPIVFMIYWF